MLRTMGRVQWRCKELPKYLSRRIREKYQYIKLCIRSLTYNQHMSQSYATDVLFEPIMWFVENFTKFLGPFFVIGVVILTAAVVYISYWIGLPWWWNKSPKVTCILVVLGNWLLINVVFHFYKAAFTSPGYPPQGELIIEAVSICKKCIAPKPPRTHHCSVCRLCVLKMDHHCPWINNCVGYANHRFFFMYMVYTTIGSLFIIIFGFSIGFHTLILGEGESWFEAAPLEGHPVRFNLTGHIVAMPEMNDYDSGSVNRAHHELPIPNEIVNSNAKYRAVLFMTLINVAVVMALGSLSIWHYRLISHGETSIEAHINQSETKRLLTLGKTYVNPYNFGKKKNWRLFLGLVKGRSIWRHILLPSCHRPEESNGLTWHTINDLGKDDKDWP